jgi:xanthine dehydrogenase YagS FAD-binding subunit
VAIALAALQADAITAGPAGERTIPLANLYQTLGTNLDPDELITRIRIPNPASNTLQRFSKFRLRDAIDFAVVSVLLYWR